MVENNANIIAIGSNVHFRLIKMFISGWPWWYQNIQNKRPSKSKGCKSLDPLYWKQYDERWSTYSKRKPTHGVFLVLPQCGDERSVLWLVANQEGRYLGQSCKQSEGRRTAASKVSCRPGHAGNKWCQWPESQTIHGGGKLHYISMTTPFEAYTSFASLAGQQSIHPEVFGSQKADVSSGPIYQRGLACSSLCLHAVLPPSPSWQLSHGIPPLDNLPSYYLQLRWSHDLLPLVFWPFYSDCLDTIMVIQILTFSLI